MTMRRFLGAVLALLLLAAVALAVMPLRLAFAWWAPAGLAAGDVSGSIWAGHAGNLSYRAAMLGDVDVALQPMALLRGEAAWRLTRGGDAPLHMTLASAMGGDTVRIERLDGRITLSQDAARALPVGVSVDALNFRDFSLTYGGNGCTTASGRVQLVPQLPIAAFNLSYGLTGEIACHDGTIILPLRGQSGMERVDVRIAPDGHYVARLSLAADTPDMARALRALGLADGADGFGVTYRGRF